MQPNQGIPAYALFDNTYRYDNERAQLRDDIRTSRSYFDQLRKAIVREYEEQGRCELIDFLKNRQRVSVDPITYAALFDAECILAGERFCDIDGERHIPHVNYTIYTKTSKKLATWEDCVRPDDCRCCDARTPEIQGVLDRIHIAGKAAYRILRQGRDAGSTPASSDQSGTRLLQDAKREAQEILEKAQTEAEGIKAGARTEAERIRMEAEAKVGRRDAVQRSPQEEVSPVRQYFEKDWEDIRQDYEKSLFTMREENQAMAAELDRMHEQMVDETNAIQRELASRMNAAVEDINGMREELYQKLRTWQAALFPQKYLPLAQCYVDLYQVINKSVKRFLESEASNQYGKVGGIFHRKAGNPSAAAGPSDAAPATLVELQKLHKNLTTFLQRFENAMNGIGLYVFYPEEGTPFDEVRHMVEDDQVDPAGRTIVGCTVPGVAKRAIDAEEDDVLIRAIVTVK